MDEYIELISDFQSNGFRFATFSDGVPRLEDAVVIMRHDVDLSLRLATEMAGVESALGVRSTYFILVSSGLYNVHSRESRLALAAIVAHGHRIGLHFDPTVFPKASVEELNEAALRERTALEAVSGSPIEHFSLHRPSATGLTMDDDLSGMGNVYSKEWTSAIRYCSDSRGYWRYGDYRAAESFKRGESVQLLTHPVWWARGVPIPHVERVREIEEESSRQVHGYLIDNLTPLREALEAKERGDVSWQ